MKILADLAAWDPRWGTYVGAFSSSNWSHSSLGGMMFGRGSEKKASQGGLRVRSLPLAFVLLLLWGGLGPTASAQAAEQLAEVLSVTASSADGMLMDAVDGDAATAWQNKREGEREAWIAFSFAGPVRLKALRLHTVALGPDVAIDVEYSPNGSSYSTATRGLKALKDQAFTVAFQRPITAEVIRLRFRAVGSKAAPRFRLREMEAHLAP